MTIRVPADQVEKYPWLVLPGRRVSHACTEYQGRWSSICGHSKSYDYQQLTEAKPSNRRCEQCLITIVSDVSAMTFKFFVGHVPADVRAKRRKAWRAYLGEI